MPVETPLLFHQREAIHRKADELGADILEEFTFPKQSEMTEYPLFREMLTVVRDRGIDYVLIYRSYIVRERKLDAVIKRAINISGAQVISASDTVTAGEASEFIVNAIGDLHLFARREDQKKAAAARKRQKRADAA
jgi:hypothetical protein